MRHRVQAYTLNMDVVVPLSLVSGLAIDTLLMVNNYRDREQDAERQGVRWWYATARVQ